MICALETMSKWITGKIVDEKGHANDCQMLEEDREHAYGITQIGGFSAGSRRDSSVAETQKYLDFFLARARKRIRVKYRDRNSFFDRLTDAKMFWKMYLAIAVYNLIPEINCYCGW